MNQIRSRLTALSILIFLAGLLLINPALALKATFDEVQTSQQRLARLQQQVEQLKTAQPLPREFSAQLAVIDAGQAQQQLNQAFSSLDNVRLVQNSESVGAYEWVSFSIQGRGDLIEIDQAIANLKASETPFLIERFSLTAIGLRRPDDELVMRADIAILRPAGENV